VIVVNFYGDHEMLNSRIVPAIESVRMSQVSSSCRITSFSTMPARHGPPPPPAPVPNHDRHFRPDPNPPGGLPATTEDGLQIFKWDVCLVDGSDTHCFAPVLLDNGQELHASNRLYCSLCRNWLTSSTSSGHYREHVKRDRQKLVQAAALSDPNGPGYCLLSFIIKRSEPMSALEWFRRCPEFANVLPSDTQFTAIVWDMKNRIESEMKRHCLAARFINLAIDGWTDLRGRRYTGIAARFCDAEMTGISTGAMILAFKAVTEIHDSGDELRRLTDRVLVQYDIKSTITNLCTDRCRMNEKAFRTQCTSVLDFLSSPYRWLPCTCHFLNNLLVHFMESIPARKAPIFRLQQRFRKKGPFLTFLTHQHIDLTIPGASPVRWYSAHELFDRLLQLWPHMVAFAQQEHKNVPELNPQVFNDLQLLHALTGAFVDAQHKLESNDFAAGSLFLSHFNSIMEAIDQFSPWEPDAVRMAHEYADEFRVDYAVEWNVFTLMTFLNPSLQWIPGTTCTDREWNEISQTLAVLVQRRIDELGDVPVQPPPRDFHSYFSSGPVERLSPEVQIDRYLQRRTTGSPAPLQYWFHPLPELTHLAGVAIGILALLATSSSMERGFSVARHCASEWQMAMLPETLSTRVLIQANWDKAGTALLEVLRRGSIHWKAVADARQQLKAQRDRHWRLHLVPRPRDAIAVEAQDPDLRTMDDSSDPDPDAESGQEAADGELLAGEEWPQ
jgi:hypothetical protein